MMPNEVHNFVILDAASKGDLTTIKWLEASMSGKEKIEAVSANNYAPITQAVYCGHLHILLHFEQYLTEGQKKEAAIGNNYEILKTALNTHKLELLKQVESYLPDDEDKKNALLAGAYYTVTRMSMSSGIRQHVEELARSLGLGQLFTFPEDQEINPNDRKRRRNHNSTFFPEKWRSYEEPSEYHRTSPGYGSSGSE